MSKLGIDVGNNQNQSRIGGVAWDDKLVKVANDTNYTETNKWII